MSVEASTGVKSKSSDAVRAYLNALSIDRNIVVIFPKWVTRYGLDERMLMNKGMYGSKSGALSWEIWFDSKAVTEREFRELQIAKSVYVKKIEDVVVRMYRHSDDIRVSCADEVILIRECEKLSELIRMSEWVLPILFLGIEIEYGEGVVLLRYTSKIMQLKEKFSALIDQYNPKLRKRMTWLPSNALDADDKFAEEQLRMLSEETMSDYRGIVGSLNFIVTLRPDAKFPQHVVASRMMAPREWDMFCLIWYLEYMIETADYPLVLGGPQVSLECMSDASFAIMPERRSIKSHFVRTCPLSGAIEASVDTIRVAVTSIWEAEVMAASDGLDSLKYFENVCDELFIDRCERSKSRVDSESGMEWFESKKISQRSRHIDIKYFHNKHAVQEGFVDMEFVTGEENESDLLTKILYAERIRKLSQRILGHRLVLGLGYAGIIEDV
jgi:hypothetical protein